MSEGIIYNLQFTITSQSQGLEHLLGFLEQLRLLCFSKLAHNTFASLCVMHCHYALLMLD